MAILVDAMSGSATECFAGGMQSIGRARVFGQTSMGQALPALFDQLPNGDVLIHAYGDFVTADGTRLEGRGVVPDEMVPAATGRISWPAAMPRWMRRSHGSIEAGRAHGVANPGTNDPNLQGRGGLCQGGLLQAACERLTALQLRHLRVLLLRGQERLC